MEADGPGGAPRVAVEGGEGKQQPVAAQHGERAAAVVVLPLTGQTGPAPQRDRAEGQQR